MLLSIVICCLIVGVNIIILHCSICLSTMVFKISNWSKVFFEVQYWASIFSATRIKWPDSSPIISMRFCPIFLTNAPGNFALSSYVVFYTICFWFFFFFFFFLIIESTPITAVFLWKNPDNYFVFLLLNLFFRDIKLVFVFFLHLFQLIL